MVKVKICGNHSTTDWPVLRGFQDRIDYIGFIFTQLSKRYVEPQKVADWLTDNPVLKAKAVGVFLNQEVDDIERMIRLTGIRTVQLHGDESPAFCQALRAKCDVSIWKVIPIEQGKAHNIEPFLNKVDGLLLDTKVKGQSGGTGQQFDWSIIPHVKHSAQGVGIPVFIAGGITPDNVIELVSSYDIDGIDVASGVEIDVQKDAQKIQALVEGVERYGSRTTAD